MDKIISVLIESSILQFGLVLVIGGFVFLMLRGRIKSVGKEGVLFNEPFKQSIEQLTVNLTQFIERTNQSLSDVRIEINSSKNDRLELRNDVVKLMSKIEDMGEQDKRQMKELLKTQILLSETSDEQKLYLFEQYKKMGGNGWMDVYIDKVKARVAGALQIGGND